MNTNWLISKYIIIYLICVAIVGPIIGSFISWDLNFLNPGYWTTEARISYLIISVFFYFTLHKKYIKDLKKINKERWKET